MSENYNNSSNVAVAKPKVGGAVFVAPAGTAVPTNAVDELGEAFKCVGYISEDGFKNNITRTSDNKKAWGGDTVYTNQTEYDETGTFTMIETKGDSMKVAFGDDNVEETDEGLHVIHNANELGEHTYVVETILGSRIKRQVVGRAKVTELGEVSSNGSDLLGYPITLGFLPDSDGVYSHEYIASISTISGDDDADTSDNSDDESEQDEANLESMTVAELKVYAATNEIALNGANTKAEIIEAIEDATVSE